MKKCPFCSEEIQETAKKCKHCGEWIMESSSDKNLLTVDNTRKVFYWTLVLWILIFISWAGSIENRQAIFSGIWLILAAIWYRSISLRRKSWKSFWYGEVISWTLLILLIPLFKWESVMEKPMLLIWQALFISYYTYPLINNRVRSKYLRIIIRVLSVLIFLILSFILVRVLDSFGL